MPSFNKVLLMGNLTRDPELRYTANNTPVCQIGVAANRRWRDQNGEMQEEVVFVDCDAWGRTAETINQYLRKGRPIFIEGRLRLDQWQDKEGNNRSRLKVVIDNFQFIDSRSDGGGGPPGGEYDGGGFGGGPPQQRAPYQPRNPQASRPYNNPPQQSNAPQPASPPQPPMEPHQPMDDSDIPF
jgi:single-strand DNA-binding protein